jgi:hypothetical protein
MVFHVASDAFWGFLYPQTMPSSFPKREGVERALCTWGKFLPLKKIVLWASF